MVHEEVDILLVEDDLHDAELTRRALTTIHVGSRVFHARDGVEALDFLFATGEHVDRTALSPPKVILLDLKLPRLDGFEVLKRIKGDARTKATPVVVLTSSHEHRDLVETYELGVNSYIVKPVAFEKFIDAVARLGLYWLWTNRPPVR